MILKQELLDSAGLLFLIIRSKDLGLYAKSSRICRSNVTMGSIGVFVILIQYVSV